jgi:hypothetical protein
MGTVRRRTKNEEIGTVLVLWKRASDNFIATVLRQFLEEKYSNGVLPNLAFAGSRAIAITD